MIIQCHESVTCKLRNSLRSSPGGKISLIRSAYPSRAGCLPTAAHFITLTAISEWVVNSPLDCLVGRRAVSFIRTKPRLIRKLSGSVLVRQEIHFFVWISWHNRYIDWGKLILLSWRMSRERKTSICEQGYCTLQNNLSSLFTKQQSVGLVLFPLSSAEFIKI